MTHYIAENGDVYGFYPEGVSVREMTSEEFQSFKYPKPSVDGLFLGLRIARDARLADTDKMLLPDYPITAEALEKVKTYRAGLRNLPDQPGAPWDGGGEETPWPELPQI